MINHAQAVQCFQQITELVTETAQMLTPRERLVLEAGLKASHCEEALTQGDLPRAQAHFVGLLQLVAKIRATKPCR